jgi:Rnl2 family RNA ligase
MKFKKYTSIENSYRSKYIMLVKDCINMGYCKDDFIVEEKVHGANFAIYYDGKELRGAKRSGFVGGDGENFFNSDKVLERYESAVKALFENYNGRPIRIVGEIYGAFYNHPDVEKIKGVKRVQAGVEYNPDVDFIAFDLSILDEEFESWTTINKDEANLQFESSGMFYAVPLFRGTLDECLAYPNAFKSTIPARLGLPEHPLENICEGVVIKPVITSKLGNGERIVIKNKNEKFTEVAHGKKSSGEPKEAVKLSELGEKMKDMLVAHLTENRLRNVISKVGNITQKDFGKLMGLFTSDAIEDFEKDYSEEFNTLEDKEQKLIKKYFAGKASELIRQNFLNIIDGIF